MLQDNSEKQGCQMCNKRLLTAKAVQTKIGIPEVLSSRRGEAKAQILYQSHL